MSNESKQEKFTGMQWAGLVVFLASSLFLGLEITWFGIFDLNMPLKEVLIYATIGSALGGTLMFEEYKTAGFFGGAIAGFLSVLALYYYENYRDSIRKIELVIVYAISILPGIGVGFLLSLIFRSPKQ